nr:MAG TPA: Transactivation domain 2 [Caudoviricetes sp.]
MDCRTVRVTSASEGRFRFRVLNFYGRGVHMDVFLSPDELKQWCAEIDSALEEVAVDDAV